MPITSQTSFRWDKPVDRDSGVTHRWSALRGMDRPIATPWGDGQPLAPGNLQVPWQQCRGADSPLAVVFQQAAIEDRKDFNSPWSDLTPADHRIGLPWNKSIKTVDVRLLVIYNPIPPREDKSIRAVHRRVGDLKKRLNPEQLLQASLYRPGDLLAFTLGGSPYLPSQLPEVFFNFTYRRPSVGAVPTDYSVRGRWGDAAKIDRRARIRWDKARPTDGKLTRVRYPDHDGPVVIPVDKIPKDPEIAEAYMIGNLVTITEMVSGEPVMASNLNLSYDEASFSWALTMDVLNRSSMDLIRPAGNVPKQVLININGHTWVMLVEKYRRNFKFPSEAYSVTGSSRMQLLAEPYATPRSGMNALDISANQIIDQLLTNTGFTCVWDKGSDWNVPDWVIPAGAFTYTQQTPMQLIARIATAIGAIARPYTAGDIISIIPRYIVPYWEWDAQTSHKILPAAIITNLGGDWVPGPDWNSCYVSGTNFGVGVMVRRAGTAGNVPAPDVLDDLMTDSTANQYRGRVELSKGGSKELVTIQLPLFHKNDANAPGLVEPGMLCDVRETDVNWFGLCLSTQIQASGVGASLVTQTLKIERHTSVIV